ncbi:GFA family protein [Pseudooceanicola sp. 502str34]
METITGHCLCGAVTLTLTTYRAEVGVCHCAMCRRWSGSAYAFFTAPDDAIRVAGEVRTHRSSSFSQRSFCPTCGSSLWLKDDGAEETEFCAGLFEAARDFPLISEAYVDQRLTALTLEGDHRRVTAETYEETFPFVPTAELPQGRT